MEPDATVLFVDDERNVLSSLERHLLREPYRKLFANSAREALALLDGEKIQVVCSDIRMPEMDGLEFLQEVRTRYPHIVRLVLSGTPEIQRVVDAINSGAVYRYITKPIDELAEFRAVLRQAFEYHELQQRQADLLVQLQKMNLDLEHWRKRVAHELEVAGKVQRRLQTTIPMLHDAYEVWWTYRPSLTIGGDFFDAVNLPDGRLYVYLGDVAGHGIGAALISTLLKATATDLIKTHPDSGPAGICQMLNHYMRAHLPDEETYATFFIAAYDPATAEWRACNCGHPRPFLLGPAGEWLTGRIPDRGDLPLGMTDDDTLYAAPVEVTWTTQPGETLLIFTDGLYETRQADTNVQCGVGYLQKIACAMVAPDQPAPRPDDLLTRLAAEGFNLADDDCCAAMVRLLSPEKSLLRQTVPVSLAAVDQLASASEQQLLAAGWPDRPARAVRLLTMEYGVNIVRHGRLPAGAMLDFQLRLDGPYAYLLFRDPGMAWNGEAHPAWQEKPPTDAENGRGLTIIQALATRLEIFRRGDYNHGYFVVARDPQPSAEVEVEAESP